MYRYLFLVLTIWLVTFSILPAQKNIAAELLGSDCMEAGSASIMVMDLESEKEVYSYDPERALPTASIQKLLTTAAVLQLRGDDFRYQTIVGYKGGMANGSLTGDLVVVGSGDPTLGSGYFDDAWSIEMIADSLVGNLRELGVNRVTGNILIDISGSPGQHVPGGWPWSDLGNYYGAGHWGLNIHDNEYRLFFNQNQTQGRLTSILRTIPDLGPFAIHNEVRTGPEGSGDQAYIYAAPHSTSATVRGTIPPGSGSFSIRGSLTDPPAFFGQRLKTYLEESQIQVEGGVMVTGELVNPVNVLFSILSPPLIDIARVTNHRSVNLYAEALLKLLCVDGHHMSQYGCGLEALEAFWESRGVDKDQMFFRDGSGLSPRNTASAGNFVRALVAVFNDQDWYLSLKSTLPEMGKEGTLQYMLRGYHGTGRIFAKSGYIGRQRSYTGYLTTESGRELAFCVMLDNYGCSATRMRQRIEGFLISLLKD